MMMIPPLQTPRPLGSLGIGGFRQQPLQPMMQLTMALHKLANKDNATVSYTHLRAHET